MYTEKQFKSCVFNPMVSEKMLVKYPKLSEIVDPEWSDDPNLDKLLRYVVMVYDPGSPIVVNEKDLNFRKGTAAELAGFDSLIEDEEFIASIYACTHLYVSDLVVKYLMRFAKSKEFASLCVVEHCYWEALRHLYQPITGDNSKAILDAVQKKAALKDELDKDMARLDKYQKSFFSGDENMGEVFKRKSYSSPEKMLKNV